MADNVIKTAVVTGASSGIGYEICRVLLKRGMKVIGIARHFDESFETEAFVPVVCDLCNTKELIKTAEEIKKKENICILVNNAGAGYYGLHEEISAASISEMMRVNAEAPMILASIFLRKLKENRGYIINISSVTAEKSNPHGCAYGAGKAALTSFSHSLFEENRKYGLKVVNIEPDMTKSNLYRNADFTADEDDMASLMPGETAQAVDYILSQREGMVITDITLRPQYHRIKRKAHKQE